MMLGTEQRREKRGSAPSLRYMLKKSTGAASLLKVWWLCGAAASRGCHGYTFKLLSSCDHVQWHFDIQEPTTPLELGRWETSRYLAHLTLTSSRKNIWYLSLHTCSSLNAFRHNAWCNSQTYPEIMIGVKGLVFWWGWSRSCFFFSVFWPKYCLL